MAARRGAAGDPPGEQAAAEEGALQRAVAVHAAAAEAGDLAGRVEARERLAGRRAARATSRSVCRPPSDLRVRIEQAHGDQRAGLGVEDPVRRRDARDLVGEVGAGAVDRGDLAVLGVRVGDLAVAGDDLGLEVGEVDQVLAGRARSCRRTSVGQRALDDEVLAVVHERLHRARAGRWPSRSLSTARTLLEVVSGFCSEPESANSFSMIFCGEHEPACSRGRSAGCGAACRACRSRGTAGRAAGGRAASNHSDEGPGMIRIACIGQIGSQLWMPST